MNNTSKVYALTDDSGRILRVDGGYTTPDDLNGWVLIDEGNGDRYNLCQSHYLPSSLMTDDGIYRWKLVSRKPVLRSESEIDADRRVMPKPPLSEIEMLKKQIEAQNEILDFYENCIAEMAEIVYA